MWSRGQPAENVVDDSSGTCTLAHDVAPRTSPLFQPKIDVQYQHHEEIMEVVQTKPSKLDVAEQIVDTTAPHREAIVELVQLTQVVPVSCAALAAVTACGAPALAVTLTAPVTE